MEIMKIVATLLLCSTCITAEIAYFTTGVPLQSVVLQDQADIQGTLQSGNIVAQTNVSSFTTPITITMDNGDESLFLILPKGAADTIVYTIDNAFRWFYPGSATLYVQLSQQQMAQQGCSVYLMSAQGYQLVANINQGFQPTASNYIGCRFMYQPGLLPDFTPLLSALPSANILLLSTLFPSGMQTIQEQSLRFIKIGIQTYQSAATPELQNATWLLKPWYSGGGGGAFPTLADLTLMENYLNGMVAQTERRGQLNLLNDIIE